MTAAVVVGLTLLTSEAADLADLEVLGGMRMAGGCFPIRPNTFVRTSSWKMTKQTNMVGPCRAVTMMKHHWKKPAALPTAKRMTSQGRPTVVAMESRAFTSLWNKDES